MLLNSVCSPLSLASYQCILYLRAPVRLPIFPGLWLVRAAQSCLLIGWHWAPAQMRPLLLHHLPHCGHDTDKLASDKTGASCKMKIRTRITTPSSDHSPVLRLSMSNCTSAWPYFDHTERKKSLRRSVLWLPPCVINQSSIVNYHYVETLTIRSHAAVLININQSQPPRVFPLCSVRACVMLMYFLPSPESPPPN